MNTMDWIKTQLINNKIDVKTLRGMYIRFLHDTHSNITESSYKRRIRETVKNIKEKNTTENTPVDSINEQDVSMYDRQQLMEILNTIVTEGNTDLSVANLGKYTEPYSIPFYAFIRLLPDLHEVIALIKKEHMLHIKDEMKVTRIKEDLSLTKKENNYLKKQESFVQRTIEVLERVVSEYKPFPDVPINSLLPNFDREREAILLFSDAHFGEIVRGEEIMQVNEYNSEIAKERMDSLFKQTINYTAELGISTITIAILGDMISGRIHEEILEHTAESTSMTIIKMSNYLGQWIRNLSEYLTVKVICMPGNHGRMTKKPNFKAKNQDNFEFLMYEFLRKEVENVVESFTNPSSMLHIEDFFDTSVCFTHGDIFKGGTGLASVSGTWSRDVAKLNGLMRAHHIPFDLMCFGHFHTGDMMLSSFDGTKIIVNGSIKGTDEFAIGAVKTGNRANQTIFTVAKNEKGVARFFNTIFLD